MSITYIVIVLIGSMTLTKKVKELCKSIKAQNKGKIKAAILFLFLTIAIIGLLIALEESKKA